VLVANSVQWYICISNKMTPTSTNGPVELLSPSIQRFGTPPAMPSSVAARIQGDDYQIRYFWWRALELITSDFVQAVDLESTSVKVIDDVVVEYSSPVRDHGGRFDIDYCQLKYHVTQDGAFSFNDMLDPDFTGTKESFLQRLFDTYRILKAEHPNRAFRMRIVSPWHWHPDDVFAGCWATEGFLRDDFFNARPQSKIGKGRKSLAKELKHATEADFYDFLRVLRLDSGRSLHSLNQSLDDRLKLAALQPLAHDQLHSRYDDLGRKLITGGRTRFNHSKLFEILKTEGLVLPQQKSRGQITLRSRLEWAKKPLETQSAHLDLTGYFDGRFPRNRDVWNKIVPAELFRFLSPKCLEGIPQPIEIFFDCHLSVAFAAGSRLNPKCGLSLVPTQKSMARQSEPWERPPSFDINAHWNVGVQQFFESKDIVLAISVTHDVRQQVMAFAASAGLGDLPYIEMMPSTGLGQLAIRDARHAWSLGSTFSSALKSRLPKSCRQVHLFYSGPAALAFILGANSGGLPSFQLYEHDFEGKTFADHYYPTLTLPLQANQDSQNSYMSEAS
jgi:hypothetical protein